MPWPRRHRPTPIVRLGVAQLVQSLNSHFHRASSAKQHVTNMFSAIASLLGRYKRRSGAVWGLGAFGAAETVDAAAPVVRDIIMRSGLPNVYLLRKPELK